MIEGVRKNARGAVDLVAFADSMRPRPTAQMRLFWVEHSSGRGAVVTGTSDRSELVVLGFPEATSTQDGSICQCGLVWPVVAP